ncbi:MAG: sugar ABC transporter ATP-binding protein [Verrucomicrobia bacterium]|nr:sugar ABC transporter ATP-binding protein [Verrucomicrobiota bacterium]MBV9275289.1 sugar ABC transporter ATP-binding protein [Verrucomicrobiota bacterium]
MTPSGGESAATGVEDLLRTEEITMNFGPVVALRNVNLHVRRGEVLGLVGDNGAGKSTLVKILTGLYKPDGGRIYLEGEEVRFRSVQHARQHGIETVFQDLALIDDLSVYHNLFLNREHTRGGWFRFLKNRTMRAAASRFLDEIGVDIPSVDAQVAKLSGGQRQAIAVARAVRQQHIKILLLDEPLAAMGAKETSLIIRLIKSLSRKANIAIIVIDHNYTHLFEICDRINVIQHGQVTLDKSLHEIKLEELVEFMVQSFRRQIATGDAK